MISGYSDVQLVVLAIYIELVWYFATYFIINVEIDFLEEDQPKKRKKGQPRPRGADNCLACRLNLHMTPTIPEREVIPYWQKKGKAGRPKKSCSHGCACPNPKCYYYGIIDSRYHAVVSNGWRGQNKEIRQWLCQECGKKFSERRGTPLYQLKKSATEVAQVMTAMAVGVSFSDCVTIFRYHHTTVTRWLVRAGKHGEAFHNQYFRELEADHIQLDELKTKVKKNQKVVWLWTAVEASSRILLGMYLGDRKQLGANTLLHEVKERLKPDCKPVYTSDGLMMYFYALTAHYGRWIWPERALKFHWEVDKELLYGQFRKVRARFKLKNIYTLVQWGERQVLTAALLAKGFTGKIQTAYVERINLTLRRLVAPLQRQTWSLSYDKERLKLHIEWVRCYYHFAREHMSLKVALANGHYALQTPAMAAGVIDRKMSVEDILLTPMYPSLC